MDAVRRTLATTAPRESATGSRDRLRPWWSGRAGGISMSHICWWTDVPPRPVSVTSASTSSTTLESSSPAEAGLTFIYPSSRATSRPGSGTRSSRWPRTPLEIPRGTIRATVLIETILAAFEMDEILYELRTHAAGLNAGRWDYLFSIIKKFGRRPEFVLPDRAQLTMTVPFMRAYTELLVKTCHRRGAHAIGGMAAFIPNRRDAEVNARALRRVREDKAREAAAGFDGAWVAHPDLGPVVLEAFDEVLGAGPTRRTASATTCRVTASDLLDVRVAGGRVTDAGVRNNVRIALRYLEAWLGGSGRGGDRQPDGGHRDRGDQPGAALAVDSSRHADREWSAGDGGVGAGLPAAGGDGVAERGQPLPACRRRRRCSTSCLRPGSSSNS